MKKPLSRKIKKWLTIAAIVYVVIGLLLYFFQDRILFRSEPLAADHTYNFSGPYKEINLPVNKDKTLGIVQFTVPDSLCKGVVLYFHGNRRNIERYAPFASYFTKNQYEVWMMDYPGFGKSTGKCTEDILYADALLLYNMAKARFSNDRIIVYGKSMGTGIAAQLASIKDCKRLILETPYYDFPSVLKRYLPIYPMNWILRYELPTHVYLPRVAGPITIFQGTDDGIISYNNAKRLIPFLDNDDEFIPIQGGSHNDLYQFPETVRKLDSLLTN